MDRWSGKRAVEARHDSRKGVGVVLRDRYNSNKVPLCSDEKKSMKFTRFIGSSDKKQKSVWSSSRSSPNGKQVTGTSSKICGSSSSTVKTEKQPMSQVAVVSSESEEDDERESEILEPYCGKDKGRAHSKLKTPEVESSNLPSSSRIKRGFRQRFGLSKQEVHPGPSGSSRGCSPLLSGVIPSGFRSEKRFSPKVDTVNKRRVYGESSSSSSSARGKNVTEPPPPPPPAEETRYRGSDFYSRQGRHFTMNDGNDLARFGSQRSVNRSSSRIRFSNRGSGRNGLPSITTTEMSRNDASNSLNSPVSLELFSGFQEFGLSGSLSRQDSFSSYSLDGISEVLPELNRIEQDIELNYEELLLMETGLLLGGLSFYDQHRDMRLDIDNMSYEELLALEEKIGTVSTALTEEAISKSLKTSNYQMKPSSYGSIAKSPCDRKGDDKCSICQEEFAIGDDVGRLHCEHTYHLKCVQGWLRMKSWCPICKAAAEASPSK